MLVQCLLKVIIRVIQVCWTLLRTFPASLDFKDRSLNSLPFFVFSVIEDLDCAIVQTSKEELLCTAVQSNMVSAMDSIGDLNEELFCQRCLLQVAELEDFNSPVHHIAAVQGLRC